MGSIQIRKQKIRHVGSIVCGTLLQNDPVLTGHTVKGHHFSDIVKLRTVLCHIRDQKQFAACLQIV